MADRETTPWAACRLDGEDCYPADTREEALAAVGEELWIRFAYRDLDPGTHDVEIYRGCTWLLRPLDPDDDREWVDHGPHQERHDSMLIECEAREVVQMELVEVPDPDCPTCGGSGQVATEDGGACCPDECEIIEWREVSDE